MKTKTIKERVELEIKITQDEHTGTWEGDEYNSMDLYSKADSLNELVGKMITKALKQTEERVIEEIENIEEIKQIKKFAQEIVEGEAQYDGADGARDVLRLCEIINKLEKK